MFHIVLYQPEIPPNTGNIIRLCANTGAHLHLIEPLGFTLDHTQLKRAGLDYHEFAEIKTYPNLETFLETIDRQKLNAHIYTCTTKGKALYTEISYSPNDIFIFGPETRGLPIELIEKYPGIKIPMLEHSRSLNLSNSAAVILYEAWRQRGFAK